MSLIKPRPRPASWNCCPATRSPSSACWTRSGADFERFGFLPVETPVFELSDVLLTKSGGETERQVYFVQSTGALAAGAKAARTGAALRPDRAAGALRRRARARSGLPVPPLPDPARLPRRARPERPLPRVLPVRHRRDRQGQRCRSRFDAEMPAVIDAVFARAGVGDFTINFNNRKLLRGSSRASGHRRRRAAASWRCANSTSSTSAAATRCVRR